MIADEFTLACIYMRSTWFLLLGLPGSGKRMLGEHLVRLYGALVLEVGELCRDVVKNSAHLFHSEYLSWRRENPKADLWPDELVNSLVDRELTNLKLRHPEKPLPLGMLWDGYGRNFEQIERAFATARALQLSDPVCIYLESDPLQCMEQIAKDPTRVGRSDGDPAIVKKRIEECQAVTIPGVWRAEKLHPGTVIRIDARPRLEIVHQAVENELLARARNILCRA